jgi:hypothetical protein
MHRSRVRVVTYLWESEAPMPEAEALLDKAQRAGVLTLWDADPGWRVVWIQGPPGEDLRRVRDALTAQRGARPLGRGE